MHCLSLYNLIIMTIHVLMCLGQTASSERRAKVTNLVRELIKRYGKMSETFIPPWKNDTDPVMVTINWYPTNILNFDERDQFIEFGGVLNTKWYDPLLQWDPNVTGVKCVEIPLDRMWKPSLILEESRTHKYKSIFYENNLALVHYDGFVLWKSPVKTSTFCRVMETRFPFDQQACKLTFSAASYQKETEFGYLNVTVPDISIDNGAWEVDYITVPNCPEIVRLRKKAAIRFVVLLKSQRRQRYYMVTLVIPCVLLSGFTPFIFLLPAETDLKVPIMTLHTVTIFLYQGLVDSVGPPTGSSLLSMFVVLTMIEAAAVTVLSIISTRVYHKKSLLPFQPKCISKPGGKALSSDDTQLAHLTGRGSTHSQDATPHKYGEETHLLDREDGSDGNHGCCRGNADKFDRTTGFTILFLKCIWFITFIILYRISRKNPTEMVKCEDGKDN